MKTFPAGLATHIAGETTTLATLWTVTRRDGTVLRFTDHDADLTVAGATYEAAVGYTATAVAASAGLAVDNLDLDAVLDSAGITEADLLAGLFDHAALTIALVNWADTAAGAAVIATGNLGEISTAPPRASTEFRSLTQRLQQGIGRVYTRRCDADLGDARCTVALAGFTVTGTVASAASRRQFTGDTAPASIGGKLTWTGGANNGLEMEVIGLAGLVFALAHAMPYTIAPGDTYSVHAGCDKNLATCRDTFNNVVNFRGFPHIPGSDQVLLYPDAH